MKLYTTADCITREGNGIQVKIGYLIVQCLLSRLPTYIVECVPSTLPKSPEPLDLCGKPAP